MRGPAFLRRILYLLVAAHFQTDWHVLTCIGEMTANPDLLQVAMCLAEMRAVTICMTKSYTI
jgi:hypothetical protein